MPYMNTQRFYGKLREAQMDAFLVFKPENFYYTTGFQNYFGGVATGVVRQAQAIVVLPADRQMKPSMIINSWEEVQARENSGFEDVRTFPLWIEIFDLQDLRGKRTRSVDKPVQYDMEKNIALLAQILREKGLTRGRLGLELDYISQKAYALLRQQIPQAELVDSSGILFDIQAVKTPGEIAILKEATHITQQAMLALAADRLLGAGVGEVRYKYQLAALKEASANPQIGFQEAKLTTSIGEDFTPKTGGHPYRARLGDIIFLDAGVVLKGYQSDLGRSLVVGQPDSEKKKIHGALQKGLEKMLTAIQPGVRCSEIFHLGQEEIRRSGLDSYTRGHLGHAIGVGKHERPPFIAPGDETVMEPNMVFSIETPLYIHGAGGFQIEDSVVITENGYELISHLPRDLIRVH
jgi:Xaa-Pro dipeptidase